MPYCADGNAFETGDGIRPARPIVWRTNANEGMERRRHGEHLLRDKRSMKSLSQRAKY